MRDPSVSSTTIFVFLFLSFILIIFIGATLNKVDETTKRIDNKFLLLVNNIKAQFVDYVNGLDKKQKGVFSVLIGWLILNLFFLFSSSAEQNEYSNLFWPIDSGSKLSEDYGFFEFSIFTMIPFFTFFLYNYINKEKK